MKKKSSKILFFVFIFGFLLRLGLMFLDFSWDVNNHISWVQDLWRHGPAGFYETRSGEVFATPYPNYPPISIIFFSIFYPIQSFLFKIVWWLNTSIPAFPSKIVLFVESRGFLAGMLKWPAIFADLGLAYLVYRFAQKLKAKNPLIFPALILFNPAFFYNSALWGQIDVIPIFLVLASVYLFLYGEKYLPPHQLYILFQRATRSMHNWCGGVLSAVLFLLSILVKPTTLVWLPIYSAFFIKKFGLKKSLQTLVVSLIIFWLVFLPFLTPTSKSLVWGPVTTFADKILTKQSLPFVTNGAFNFWVLITHFKGIKDTAPFLFGISYQMWGIILTGVTYLYLIFRFLKIKITAQSVFYSFFLTYLVSFLFLTKMHERYTMLPLVFILLASIKERRLSKWFWILSILSFLNLYHSWPVPMIAWFHNFLKLSAVHYTLAALNLFVFFYLLSGVLSRRYRE